MLIRGSTGVQGGCIPGGNVTGINEGVHREKSQVTTGQEARHFPCCCYETAMNCTYTTKELFCNYIIHVHKDEVT